MPTLTDWVAAFSHELTKRIGEKRYHLWFAQQTRIHWADDQLTIGVPNRFFLDWLQGTFGPAIREAAASVAGHPMAIRFVVDAGLFQAHRQQLEATHSEPSAVEFSVASAVSPCRPSNSSVGTPTGHRDPCDCSRLEEFIAGESNRLAYAAVLQLVESLRPDINWFGPSNRPLRMPLTIYGPHGVGKTHLLEGLAEALGRIWDKSKIVCLTAEDFTNQFLQAMRQGKLSEFRRRFRSAKALLLDDLQFLEGKRATQEELLHTVETLSRQGHVFVAACERHPRQVRWLPELVDRLAGGAVWPIELPDAELRRRLIQTKAQKIGLPLSDDVVAYLAQSVRGNVRELEGALYAVFHFATVHRQPITRELVQTALGRWLRPQPKTVSLRDIERAVARVLHLRPGVLRGREKVRSASYPRMLAMYLARKHTTLSYSEIGRFFGGRNHSTVIAAQRKVTAWLAKQGTFRLAGQTWYVADLLQHIEREL
ncbi:MAG: DnaA/Hda family protein [Gemmatales bacterium]|nr:DnaA/Hda family protein [Gemmatales bacterium]MCS7161668.1 DnaA/Hda family protein [Gemmatales bacterium]MDW8176871.1 DnaA/Hda family protein [Gemmatales bacterium]MDW8223615.1 DnaA/Hda family protein [Gemmatales bacterium]